MVILTVIITTPSEATHIVDARVRLVVTDQIWPRRQCVDASIVTAEETKKHAVRPAKTATFIWPCRKLY